MTSTVLLPLVFVLGFIIVLVVAGFAALALLAAIRRQDDTRSLKKAEERSNQHGEEDK